MCTVYLWIGIAVNLARFLVPHSYFTVAAREKISHHLNISIHRFFSVWRCTKYQPK